MEVYQNLGGNSGVYAFLIDDNSITIEFSKGGVYLYNYSQPGSSHVEQMKSLALSGSGLNSYIGRHVRDNYAAKLK